MMLPLCGYARTSQYSLPSIELGARKAQEQCYMKIHFDTFEYADCINELSKTASSDDSFKLGILYFGYVGAMDSVRTGMYGARNTAWVFLKEFRRLQKILVIDDTSLCGAIPGNCEIRISQIKLMDRARKPKPVDLDGALPMGAHAH